MTDDDEEEKSAYPPVRAMSKPNERLPLGFPPNPEPDMGGMSMPPVNLGDREPTPPQRPQWKDYAPPERHGLAKFGATMASFAPRFDEPINQRPQERAQSAYKNATADYDQEQKQGIEQRESKAKIGHEAAQGEHEQATAEATRAGMKTVQISIPPELGGGVANIPEGKQEDFLKSLMQIHGRGNLQDTKNQTSKDLQDTKGDQAMDLEKERQKGRERIATGHNLAQTEIARIKADAANDPNKLTNTMKTMKQQAQATLPKIATTLDETEQIASMLGPAEGRWNAFMTGKVGAGDPKFKHYMDEIGMVQSAVTLAHARGRMSDKLFDHFETMFDAGKQTPENMIQALTVAQEWLTDYANMGEPGSPVGNKPAATGGGTPSGDIYARDEKGKLHKAPAGTALPSNWKPEKR